jgi:hypothetical protein
MRKRLPLAAHRRAQNDELFQTVHKPGAIAPLQGLLELVDKPQRSDGVAIRLAALAGGKRHVSSRIS